LKLTWLKEDIKDLFLFEDSDLFYFDRRQEGISEN